MAKVQYPLTNFTTGELTPRLYGRPELEKYRNAAKTITNFNILPHGGLRKRAGTMYVSEIKASANAVRLVPFQFNTEQAYILEFGPSYIRVYKDQAIVVASTATITGATKANPCVITATSHGFSNGDHVYVSGVGGMVELNNRRFTVANQTANTFELSGINSTAYTTYTSGGTASDPVEITTTYTAGELDDLSFAQSADTLYIAHPAHPVATLTRSSHTAWTLADAPIVNGPFRAINTDEDLKIAVVTSGAATITGATQADPCVITTSAAHGFLDGATVLITSVSGMTELNNNRYVVKNPTSTTFELSAETNRPIDATGYTAYTSGGTATQSTSSWGTFSPGTTVQLSSTAAVWQSDHVGALFRVWEPGQVGAIDAPPIGVGAAISASNRYTYDKKVYGMSGYTGAGGYTTWAAIASVPAHEAGTVPVTIGTYLIFNATFLHDLSAVIEITGYTSSTLVEGVVRTNHVPESVITYSTEFWEEGAWSDVRGYPGVLTFYEQRLWAAASTADPQTVWASKTGVFTDFQDGTLDDRALIYQLASEQVEVIKWITAGKTLVLGTASSEYAIAASNNNEALTPTNLRISRQMTFGSGNVKPIRIGNVVLFGQRHGKVTNNVRRIRELVYSFDTDSYVAPDLTILSEHITGDGISEMAFQLDPHQVVWCVREDGALVSLTYEREQQVVAWARHTVGGTSVEVERVAVIPGSSGDEVWLVVKRTINGGTKRYIEVLTAGVDEHTPVKADGVYVDASLTYSGSSTSTITGLWHLEGETVYVLNNGNAEASKTVTNGAITVSNATTKCHVGLQYTAVLETLEIEAGAQAGAAQSRVQRISQVYARLMDSLGGTFGRDSSNQDLILYREPTDVMGSSPPLKTGLVELDLDGGYQPGATLRIEHDEPLPFTILGMIAEISTTG